MKRIYMDHNATTPIHPEVLEEMYKCMKDIFGNPSSIHYFGQQARKRLDNAREQVAELIGAKPGEIVFTSGGTESNNLAFFGIVEMRNKGNINIITSAIEHPAVLNVCKYLETKKVKINYLPVDEDGLIDPEQLLDGIDSDTIMVSVMLANNDVGTIEPVKHFTAVTREKGVISHSDSVQAAGKIPVNVNELGVDLLSISAHKLNGPKGVGALYVRKGTMIAPILHGGGHEHRRRAGTENLPGIVGFGKACELARLNLEERARKEKQMLDKLEHGLKTRLSNININGENAPRLPNTLNTSFPGIEADTLLMNLDLLGIAVSTGAACSSDSLKPSHVLNAMGRTTDQAYSSIRFSLGWNNTLEEVETVLDTVVDLVEKLRDSTTSIKNGDAPSTRSRLNQDTGIKNTSVSRQDRSIH